MQPLLLALLIVTASHGAAFADTAAHSDSLRVESLLSDILGPGKARLFIRASQRFDLSPDRGRDSPETSVLWDRWESEQRASPVVLPGYRVPQSLSAQISGALRAEAEKSAPRKRELRHATLVLDPSVAESEFTGLRNIVVEALGLDVFNGETLIIKRRPFYPHKGRDVFRLKLMECLLYAATASVILLVAYLLFPARRKGPPVYTSHHRMPHDPAPPGTLPCLGMLAPHHAPNAAKFLNSEPADSAVYILRTTEIDVAADIFCRLDPKKRFDAAHGLLFAKSLEKNEDAPLEERVLSSVADFEGGEGLLENLLLRSPERVRREVLSRLFERAPQRVRRLKSKLITMEDLAVARASSLQTCLSAFSTEEIALSLFETAETTRRAHLNALPETVRDMVTDRLRYLVPDSYAQVQRMRSEIFARWKKLEQYGRVPPLRPAGAR